MPGYIGRKFALQGDLDPLVTGEAILELTVAHLRKVFSKRNEPLVDHLRNVVKKYDFIFEGTELEDETNDVESSDEIRSEAPANVEFEAPTEELSDN
jgi:hypothetical protein